MKILFPISAFFLISMITVWLAAPLEWHNAPSGLFVLTAIALVLHFVLMSAVDTRIGANQSLWYFIAYGTLLYSAVILSWIIGMRNAHEAIYTVVYYMGLAFLGNVLFSWIWYLQQRYREMYLSNLNSVFR